MLTVPPATCSVLDFKKLSLTSEVRTSEVLHAGTESEHIRTSLLDIARNLGTRSTVASLGEFSSSYLYVFLQVHQLHVVYWISKG